MTQQQYTTDAPVLPIVMAAPHLDCAWCLKEQAIAAGEGSHGMCKRHRAQMLAQHRAIRAARLTEKEVRA